MNELINRIILLPHDLRRKISKYFLKEYYLNGDFGDEFYIDKDCDALELHCIKKAFKKRGWDYDYTCNKYFIPLDFDNHESKGALEPYIIGMEDYDLSISKEVTLIIEQKCREMARAQIRRIRAAIISGEMSYDHLPSSLMLSDLEENSIPDFLFDRKE